MTRSYLSCVCTLVAAFVLVSFFVATLALAVDVPLNLDAMLAAKWSVTRKSCGASSVQVRNGTWHIQRQEAKDDDDKDFVAIANGTAQEVDEASGEAVLSCSIKMSRQRSGTPLVTLDVCGGVAAPETESGDADPLTLTFADATKHSTYDDTAKIGSARATAQRCKRTESGDVVEGCATTEKFETTINSVSEKHIVVRIIGACSHLCDAGSAASAASPAKGKKGKKKRQPRGDESDGARRSCDEVMHMFRVDEDADTLWGFWLRHGFLLMFAVGMIYFKIYTSYRKMNQKIQLKQLKQDIKDSNKKEN